MVRPNTGRDAPVEPTSGSGESPLGPHHIKTLDFILGDRLRLARQLKGVSASDLGQMIGVTYQQIFKYERGNNRISASLLHVIASVLERPVQWFYGPDADGLDEGRLEVPDDYLQVLGQLRRVMLGLNEQDKALLQGLLNRLTDTPEAPARSVAGDQTTPPMQGMAPAPHQHAAPSAVGRLSVLLVDDDPDVLAILGSFVDKAGYQSVRVMDGNAALEILTSKKPLAAIVTDYAMPGLNGAALLVEASRIRLNLPALMVTGFADSTITDKLPPGIEVLSKPFSRTEFVSKLHKLVKAPLPDTRGHVAVE